MSPRKRVTKKEKAQPQPEISSSPVIIDGHSLTLEQIENVALRNSSVAIQDVTKTKLLTSRNVVEELATGDDPLYGVNTGFGSLSQVKIPSSQIEELQLNLLRSHSVGVGEPYSPEVTRAIMLLRANVLAAGHSGVRPEILEQLITLMNENILPKIPQKGSVGASGDLAPLAHLALLLVGEGEALVDGEFIPGNEALQKAGLSPLKLQAKEGLALINGTQVMTGLGALTLLRCERLAKYADIAGALTIEATRGSFSPFDSRLVAVRPYQGAKSTAAALRKLGEGSDILVSHQKCGKVQDPYSLRCIPQVHGAVKDALSFVRHQMSIEINAITDNPIVFPAEKEILSGGNFHGQSMAMALDFLAIAVSELGSISERRIEKLMIPDFSQLPPFLTRGSGLHSGFSMIQVTAASLVSENKILTHPASTSTQSKHAPFIVAASGCAPPIPPSPAERINFPSKLPWKWMSPADAKVSYVPCKIPWEPM